ncbi:efflux transporter outer membrane subunit [bacterium M00.F.Ca.ET.228.01.1.1]|uniref:efflux transporter outer membrane subunit n=1 Tax=Paraburkholderia phenoliruptrix TaxID=252970 RepID=UPI001091AAF1|nr:efflux transporter outer membrane subunit [Paraburkholderia phenoliruptrix]MBW9127580.1 efflux transporter outer membrane subunit [Paraburkholderia ginsengiterrae]TGP46086.1 efflux transporter outer membrane subunit [bacterium M00.F.Ca.ET.228.01.1.1]TGS04002.1 efflux transporter outer membrane subunit [bacterium M00.F.Ca.ET.191.01.1.1]TGU07379.1 efflux transporter outer membrane subunit [bacterium M00.F.Ca.ET.155.01.1.1]MBW9102359.1 efflux transporter outer membrane subunit [Paraburkholderi
MKQRFESSPFSLYSSSSWSMHRRTAWRPATAALASALLLCACIGDGGIHTREAPLDAAALDPGVALRATEADAKWPAGGWWRQWNDPQLDQLVTDATAGNPGLQAIGQRIEVARYQAQIAGAAELPQLNASGSFERRRYARYTTPAPPGGTTVWSNSIEADLSFDLDLWGKSRALREGALDNVRAAAADARFAQVELQTAVVRGYVQLSLAYALLDVQSAVQSQQQRTLDIAKRRFRAGVGSGLEVSQAESQLAMSTTRLQQAQHQIALARIGLAGLAGKGPGYGDTLRRPDLALSVPVKLPASLPAELLGHRADVVANRWRVQEADKGIAAAHADFYPDINLVALASLGSAATFGGFLNFVDSNGVGHGVGAAISLPVFDGGRRRGNYGVAVASRDAAVDAYNQSVVNALQGVAAQVVSLRSLEEQQASVESTLASTRKSFELADAGYRSGITEFLNVLAAQNAQLEQQESLAAIQARRLDAWALLMKELGGGFQADELPELPDLPHDVPQGVANAR